MGSPTYDRIPDEQMEKTPPPTPSAKPKLSELQKYELVNSSETIAELQQSVDYVYADEEQVGRTKNLNRDRMRERIRKFVEGQEGVEAKNITREYGFRQQALYLQHYKSK